jgi:YggT family protein
MVAMIALSNLLSAVAQVLHLALQVYMWLIIARALLSWVNPDPYNPIVRFLYNVTEPVLGYIRRRVPMIFAGLDLSPLVVLALILLLDYFLMQTLLDWSITLKQTR